MFFDGIVIITLCFYMVGTLLQGLVFLDLSTHLKGWVLTFGAIAVCLHAALLHAWIDTGAGQNLNFFNLFSLTAWLVAVIVLLVALRKPIESLLLFVFPINMLSIVLVIFFPRQAVINTLVNHDALFHILLSVLTFCILCVAGLLAASLAIQEWCLRCKKMLGFIQRLPSLETMEILLFQVIGLGFILLTAVLASSFYVYHAILLTQADLQQKAVLVTVAWLVFAVLLLGRYRHGWRGRKAIYGTLVGVLLLFVAYFGSKFLLHVPR